MANPDEQALKLSAPSEGDGGGQSQPVVPDEPWAVWPWGSLGAMGVMSQPAVPNETWAVVVVHGVGPTKPGKTLDLLLKPLMPNYKELSRHEVRLLNEPPPRPPPQDLDPAVEEERRDDVPPFPMHL